MDLLVESYAGPHDWLNSGYWYDAAGNIKQGLSGFQRGFGEVLNYANVVPASVFVAGSWAQPYTSNIQALADLP